MSKASSIAAEISNRLGQITIANGFSTDIGTLVFRGVLKIEPSDLPCVVLVEGEDRVEDQKRGLVDVKLAQRYIVEGHDNCNPQQPNDKAHLILADLKKALFGSDMKLGGLVIETRYIGRAIGPRPDGTAFVAASIEFECVFSESLSNP